MIISAAGTLLQSINKTARVLTKLTGNPEWELPTLITPRQALRDEWNKQCLRWHCKNTGHHLYVTKAEDSVGKKRRALTMEEKVKLAGTRRHQLDKAEHELELAIGMKIMLLNNVATEADLSNGTRGVVTDIVLDPRDCDKTAGEDGLTRLNYPPLAIMFKPEKCTLPPLPGLPQGTIPLFPKKTAITIKTGNETTTVQRRQFCVTGGYGLTDFKAQGQTMGKTVIDIKKPPTGAYGSMNVYVARSRCKRRSDIRILREFETHLFTTPPSQVLLDEDERISKLDEATKKRYDETH